VSGLIAMVLLGLLALPLWAVGPADVQVLQKSAREIDLTARDAKVVPSAEIQNRAAALVELYRSPEYQRRLYREQARIRKLLGADGKMEGDVEDGSSAKSVGRPVYIFVSSSLPLKALRQYAADMAKVEGYDPVMVFRGFIGGAGKIGPTASLIGDILKVDDTCDLAAGSCDAWPVSVTVDPEKFRKFNIDKVPAFVVENGQGGEPLVAFGDASLGYVLEQFAAAAKAR